MFQLLGDGSDDAPRDALAVDCMSSLRALGEYRQEMTVKVVLIGLSGIESSPLEKVFQVYRSEGLRHGSPVTGDDASREAKLELIAVA